MNGRIGIEEHWLPAELDDALRAVPEPWADPSLALNDMGDNLARLGDLDAARIATMDAQDVDLQILSVAPPATQILTGPDALALSRDANDRVADAVRRNPARLRAMATLPLSDPAATADELRRADGLGLRGAMVYPHTRELRIDDARFDDLFAVAAELGHPVFIHPQAPTAATRRDLYSGFDATTELGLATFGWGWHIEAAIAALRLIVRGTLDRHPELQLVLGHWGELLLFWGDRVDGLARIAALDRPVTEYFRTNLHITSSGMLSPALLRHALEVTTIDRLLFSTDYPFQQPTAEEIAAFGEQFSSDEDRERFFSGNARRLFRIGDELGDDEARKDPTP